MEQQQDKIIPFHSAQKYLKPINSRKRLSQLKKQQNFLYDTFKIDNFYNNGKLDLSALKTKITQIKGKQQNDINTNPQDKNIILHENNKKQRNKNKRTLQSLQNTLQKLRKCQQLKQQKQTDFTTSKQTIQSHNNNNNNNKQRNYSSFSHHNKISKINQKLNISKELKTNYKLQKINKQQNKNISNNRYGSLEQYDGQLTQVKDTDNSLYGEIKLNFIPKIQNIGGRQSMTQRRKLGTSNQSRKQLFTSRLQSISSYKKPLSKIRIQTQTQLQQFRRNIIFMWTIYQKLSQIVKILSLSSNQLFTKQQTFQQLILQLCEYKQLICSNRSQFLINIIQNSLQYSQSKSLILSRLLQNLSIIYIILQITQKTRNNINYQCSHLVNFVGLSSNNILLLLRMISLISIIDDQLTITQDILNVFKTISQFQINSYKIQLVSIKDVAIRMEHNNSSISIIQNKLNNKMISKQYHINCIDKFMRNVVIDKLKNWIEIAGDKSQGEKKQIYQNTKPFFQYSYFIFQYLAFYLHHEKIIGLFPTQIETTPAPYLPLVKQFTVIFDPLNIFLHQSKGKYFVRAYTNKFIQQLSQKCNIVFWSPYMPQQIDHIIDLIDNNKYNHTNSTKTKFLQTTNNFTQNNTKNNKIKRLYQHHCIYYKKSKHQQTFIKDITRIGCQPGKYIIFDSNLHNYFQQQEQFIVYLPWKGESKDTKLLTVLDLILPCLKQGNDLTHQLKAIKVKLQYIFKNQHKNKKVFEVQQHF